MTAIPYPQGPYEAEHTSWDERSIDENRHPNFAYPRSFTHAASSSDDRQPHHPSDRYIDHTPAAAHAVNGAASPVNGGRLEPPPKLRSDLSANGSSGESLIDLYRQHKNHAPTMNGANNRQRGGAEPESSRWIHRDKLTQIEIQEYRDRGMEVPLELLRRAGMQPWRQDETANEPTSNEVLAERSPQRSVFPPQQQPTTPEDDYDDEPFIPEDPRTPEEIALSHEDGSYPYQSPGLKASSSRIPLSTSSPLPVPIEHLERSTPLPRKRGASDNWDDEGISYPKMRSRSHSVASQALFDEAEGRESRVGSTPSSPEKAKPKPGPPNRRYASPRTTSGATAKSRNASLASRHSPSASGRPGTRSGPDSRPSTAVHRPEGEPPWLATMFKPDPRLPPDQQMLPTHAKRLLQEQWEREGKPGSAFDRSFTPVSVHQRESPQPSPQVSPQPPTAAPAAASPSPAPSPPAAKPAPEIHEATPEAAWPLRPPPAERKGSTTEHAGYSTMPKVQHTPPLGSLPSPRRMEAPPIAEPVEKPKEKGCGCCVVM